MQSLELLPVQGKGSTLPLQAHLHQLAQQLAAVAQLLGQTGAIGEQGHDRAGGGGGAVVGDQIGDGGVVLVAEAGDQRQRAGRQVAGQGLAVEHGQILAAAAAANGLPELHSLPAAPTAIYLDFDGEGSNSAYDVDGDPTTFNATEAATITEAWRQISVYFAMFNVDVTTVKPTVPFAWHVSSPDIVGGYSYVGVFLAAKATADAVARVRLNEFVA